MSHQFSFLQVFAGYKSLQCKILSTCRLGKELKMLRADLRVKCCRRVEILLHTDISKFQTDICKRLIFFQQMSFCWSISAFFIIICKLCHLPIGRFKHFNNQYIQWLKKLLPQLSSYEDDSYIFDTHIVVSLCKYLLQLGFLNKRQCIYELQAVELVEVGK